jgi:hypothetical protein
MDAEQQMRIIGVAIGGAIISLVISLADKALKRRRERKAARDSKPLRRV